MSVFTRVSAVIVALGAALLAVVVGASTAQAAPYSNQIVCSVSDSTPPEHSTLTISCTGFNAHVLVHIKLHTAVYNLGSATTDGSGAFSRPITLPDGVTGPHTLTVNDPISGDTGSVPIVIGGSGTGGGSTGGGGGITSNTGVAVLGIGTLGVALLAAGGVMLYTGRRRRVMA